MLKFAAMGYACLPVHDSFIVHHGMQDDLTEVMKTAFEEMYGVSGETSFEIGVGEAVEATGEPLTVDVAEVLAPAGYEGRLHAFQLMQEQAY